MGDKIDKILKDWKVGRHWQGYSATMSRKRGKDDK